MAVDLEPAAIRVYARTLTGVYQAFIFSTLFSMYLYPLEHYSETLPFSDRAIPVDRLFAESFGLQCHTQPLTKKTLTKKTTVHRQPHSARQVTIGSNLIVYRLAWISRNVKPLMSACIVLQNRAKGCYGFGLYDGLREK